MASQYGIVEYFGLGSGHHCGYCKGSTTNISHGMWAHALMCQDYEDLINRGWRRSGKYVYKPLMNKTCCPQYTIRCNVTNIKLTKSQKKVLKRMNRFLLSEKGASESLNKGPNGPSGEETSDCTVPDSDRSEFVPTLKNLEVATDVSVSDDLVVSKRDAVKTEDQASSSKEHSNVFTPGTGIDMNKPICRKAKEIRKERRIKKLIAKAEKEGKTLNENEVELPRKQKNAEKSLEDFIEETLPSKNTPRKLEVKLVRSHPRSQAFTDSFRKEFLLFQRYQVAIHKETTAENTEDQFRRFLVDSPLEAVSEETRENIPSTGLGSFHQQYYLDGNLIAVGVLDILPHCVSSKYFFYDPEYEFLSLGTYSALREIYFVRSLYRSCPTLEYYYMGFYIHSCPKMRYKGRYNPSFLLCPETYQFVSIEQCTPKLDKTKYARLGDASEEEKETFDINGVLVLYSRQAMPYMIFDQLLKSNGERSKHRSEVTEYTSLAGQNVAQRMLLFRKSNSFDSDSDE